MRFFFFFRLLYFERTRRTASTWKPCLINLSTSNEARPRERSDRGRFLSLGKKASPCRGAYRVPLFNLSVGMCVCVCVTFVVFTDCESCTRPISTNPGSMEAGEYGLTRGTCFITCRLEVVAVAGLLCLSWCVFGGADFFVCVFFDCFFFERTRPAASMRSPCLICLSTSNEARPRERSDRGRFFPWGKEASSYRGAYRVSLIN